MGKDEEKLALLIENTINRAIAPLVEKVTVHNTTLFGKDGIVNNLKELKDSTIQTEKRQGKVLAFSTMAAGGVGAFVGWVLSLLK